EELRRDKTRLEKQTRNVIEAQRDMPDDIADSVRQAYTQELRSLSVKLKQVTEQIQQQEYQDAQNHAAFEAQQHSVNEVRDMGLAAFWQRPEREINQLLHRIMGGWRVEFLDGKITTLKRCR